MADISNNELENHYRDLVMLYIEQASRGRFTYKGKSLQELEYIASNTRFSTEALDIFAAGIAFGQFKTIITYRITNPREAKQIIDYCSLKFRKLIFMC